MKTRHTHAGRNFLVAAVLCGSILPVLIARIARAAEAKPDLSTPEKALAAFTKALDEGDPAKLDAVTSGDATQQEWIHALGGQLAAFKELEAALAKKYGPAYAGTDSGKEIVDQIDDARDEDLRADLKKAKVGAVKRDSAVLVLDEAAPDDHQGRLVRTAGRWKVDLESLAQYASANDVPVLQAMAKAAGELAHDVGSGKFPSIDEVSKAIEERLTAASESAAAAAKKSASATPPKGAAKKR
jgi:hypothetical protein